MSAIGSASPASAFAFAAAGMASADARFGAAASAVVNDPTGGGLAEAAVAVTQSKAAFEASARVADVADQMQGVLIDLLA